MKKILFALLFVAGSAHATNQVLNNYAGWTLLTIASTTTGGVTAASTAVDNTTTKVTDAEVFCIFKSPTAGSMSTTTIALYGYGYSGQGTAYSDGITGSSATVTLTSPPNLPPPFICNTVANSTNYFCGPYNLGTVFSSLPDKWGIAYTNNNGTLNLQSGSCWYQPINVQTNQ